MWFRKKAVKADFLECAGCGCLMRTARKVVEVKNYGVPRSGGGFLIYAEPWDTKESFCGRCAPPYDMRSVGPTPYFYRTEPSKNIEVTEKGKRVVGGE